MIIVLIQIYIFLLVIAIAGFYIWMRSELQKRGRSHPLFNSSFNIYADFMDIASTDNILKKRKNKAIIITFLVWISICIIFTINAIN